jgi:hypothetical protein
VGNPQQPSNKRMITKSLAAYNVACSGGENLSVTMFMRLAAMDQPVCKEGHFFGGLLTTVLTALLINRLPTAFPPRSVDQYQVILMGYL